MNSPEVKAFIRENSQLFWYTPEDKKENISLEFLVEQVLNYGDWEATNKLFDVVGLDTAASIFYKSINESDRTRGNYFELVLNYFDLFFKKYAQRDIV